MNQLMCPNCGQVFTIDESQYNLIVQQVRTQEFRSEVNREASIIRDKLQAQHEATLHETLARANEQAMRDKQVLNDQLANARTELVRVQGELQLAEQKKSMAVMEAVTAERQRALATETQLKKEAAEKERQLTTQLEYYKDLKTRMSTKMVGETLEQHCWTEFSRVRTMAFPHAYFEKDNQLSSSGSKGDFIFSEKTEDGIPLLSIMFEMKNEMDTTATKHKNEDFLKELDKDRREKGCEYAVLVSMLEADSDYYNDGIVDMSHRYEKMYVIRPQFFLIIISILRNAALNALASRRELARMKQMNIDVVRFEDNLAKWKDGMARNSDLATRHYDTSIDEIDKAIDHLQKVKNALLQSDRNIRILNDKVSDLTVQKLTADAPAVREMFATNGNNR